MKHGGSERLLPLQNIAFCFIHPRANKRPAVIRGKLILADRRSTPVDDGKTALERDPVGAHLP